VNPTIALRTPLYAAKKMGKREGETRLRKTSQGMWGGKVSRKGLKQRIGTFLRAGAEKKNKA